MGHGNSPWSLGCCRDQSWWASSAVGIESSKSCATLLRNCSRRELVMQGFHGEQKPLSISWALSLGAHEECDSAPLSLEKKSFSPPGHPCSCIPRGWVIPSFFLGISHYIRHWRCMNIMLGKAACAETWAAELENTTKSYKTPQFWELYKTLLSHVSTTSHKNKNLFFPPLERENYFWENISFLLIVIKCFPRLNICRNLYSSPKRSSCVPLNKSKVTLSGLSSTLAPLKSQKSCIKVTRFKKPEGWNLDLFSLVLINRFISIIITTSSWMEIATFLFRAKWKLGLV